MNVGEMKVAIKSLAEQDLSISDGDLETWIDQGIHRINQALKCNIPSIKNQPDIDNYEPEFDERFHEVLVEFAAMKYRESDGDYNPAQYHLAQFNDMQMTMQRDMVVKPSQRMDDDVQQIKAVDGQTSYYLSMPSGSYFDKVEVYVNDSLVNPLQYRISFSNRTIVFKIPLVSNDKITVIFENNSDLNNPPYEWWGQSGW